MSEGKKLIKADQVQPKLAGYEGILVDLVGLLESARRASARAVNAVMTATYWEIGHRIIEFEQHGAIQADYGTELLKRLGEDLTQLFGRGFSWRNLYLMRNFYLAYPKILQTVSAISSTYPDLKILQTMSKEFPLSWSHYVRLLSVDKTDARKFYESEALRGGWSVRQLDRQISTLFYERTLLSRNKAGMLRKGEKPRPEDLMTPDQEIKDPYVLEFLNLKDEYSENDFEEALIGKLETFLLELGGDFTFVGRQRRLRIGNEWYRVDLLFFHRRLRCLVVIDLKVGKFTAADAGQMHLYLNYARENWTNEGENPPVGLILCADKDSALARYALEGLPNKVLAAEYRMNLPAEKLLVAELKKTQKLLADRILSKSGKNSS